MCWSINICASEDWSDDSNVELVAMVDHRCGAAADRDALLPEASSTTCASPSTYLWKRTIEDLHVNSIWQRLRKNLLLLLQLIAAGLFILACLRPGMSGNSTVGNRSIFLIDNSASMQATDVDGSRLRQAKNRVIEMIDSLGNKDAAMVIAFSNSADVRQGFTTDRRRLREAVEGIQPTNRTTDLQEALRAASGLANPGRTSQIEDLNDIQVAEARPATLYVVSDGAFPFPSFQLGNLNPEFLPIGSETIRNVAVLAFTAERNLEHPDQVEAFARIRNFGSQKISTTASLLFNGNLVDASDVNLDAGAESGVAFQLKDISDGELMLQLDVADDLLIDNVAYAGLDPPRQLQVALVTPGNKALVTALTTAQAQAAAIVTVYEPDALTSPEMKKLATSGKVDLFLYDRCSPPEMPRGNTLFLGSIPPDGRWKEGEAQSPVFVIDVNHQHPMLQYVDFSSVKIFQGHSLSAPEGSTALVRSDGGVLVAIAPRDAFQDAVIGFPLFYEDPQGTMLNTDWLRKNSFPVFLLNALEYLGGAIATSGSTTVKPGEPATLALANRYDRLKVTAPDKSEHTIDREGEPQVVYSRTESPGFYRVQTEQGDKSLQVFTVNLFSERESDLELVPEVMLGDIKVKATQAQELVRHEYWRWILLAALVVLTAEWILYTRRVAV